MADIHQEFLMKIDRSSSPGFVASSDGPAASPTRNVRSMAIVLATIAWVGASNPASASPAVETGTTVIVTGSETPAEASYVSSMLRHLDETKRYPTGREASLTHPSGTTAVWVDIARDGHVAARGVMRSSGSTLLDWTATNLVGRADHPAFPTGAWAAGPTHRFLVRYRFLGEADASGSTQVEVAAQ